MRRARITFPGALHHVMNRGHDGTEIFYGNQNKAHFLDYLAETSKKMKIRIFAYCIMDTHYHLVLENSSGKMSEFLKQLNGLYGMYYRKIVGGRGYVFQGRFKSTLIEEDAYLLQSIVYLLQNPVRAGIVQHAADYIWSSTRLYYSNESDAIVDTEFVDEIFGTKKQLMAALRTNVNNDLPIKTTKYGDILGTEGFLDSALEKYDRRTKPSEQSQGMQRMDDRYFEPVEKVIQEFENIKGIKIEVIDLSSLKGKRLRGELLVFLKDRGGLTYKEISRDFDIFLDLRFSSLRELYRSTKKRMREL